MNSKHLTLACTLLSLSLMNGCKQDDPEPVHEQEVITTVEVTLTPEGDGQAVTLRFFDSDGELGDAEPVISATGPLQSGTVYSAEIGLRNETVSPTEDIAEEVSEEAGDHLFCFDVDPDIVVISYNDEDENGLPVGLSTTWEAVGSGSTEITVSLRHQAGTKTGDCPGSGDTDVEVTFNVIVE